MNHLRLWCVWIGTALLGTASVVRLGGQTTEPPLAPSANQAAAQDGVEVLTRGPIHEAYAEPVTTKPQARPAVAKQPPEPVEEIPAEQKPDGDNVQWIPGYWAWDDDRSNFLWVSGFWRVPPPDRQWVPGRWNQANGGWQWVPGFWAQQQQQEMSYLPPPPEMVQAAPSVPAPGPDSSYVPGTWVYRESRYVWRPGFWHVHRPGWVWVPAHYVWTPAGYVFIDGYWDYPLRDRGLLFAPVAIDVAIYSRPSYCYRPAYVIQDDCLYGALFVRPSHGCYYYGDYFDVGYRGRGFTAWFEFRIGGGPCYDPLFSYYSFTYRSDRSWEVGLRECYAGRYNGTIARPPRTIVQQNNTRIVNNTVINKTIVNNTTVNNINNTTVNNTTNNVAVNRFVNNNSVVTPLAQVDRTAMKLTPVSRETAAAEQKSARQLQQVSAQRKRLEDDVVTSGPATNPNAAPRTVKVDLPKPVVERNNRASRTPPPLPTKPEVRTRSDDRNDNRPGRNADDAKSADTPTRPDARPARNADTKPEPRTRPDTTPAGKPEPKVDPRTQPNRPDPRQDPRARPDNPPTKPAPKSDPGTPSNRPDPRQDPRARPDNPPTKPEAPTPPTTRPNSRPDPRYPPESPPAKPDARREREPKGTPTSPGVMTGEPDPRPSAPGTQPAARPVSRPPTTAPAERGGPQRQTDSGRNKSRSGSDHNRDSDR